MGSVNTYIIIGVGIFIIVAVCYISYLVFRPRSIRRTLASDLEITNDWTEIVPLSTIKVQRDLRSVVLIIEKARLLMKRDGLQLPNGKTFIPELQIQGLDGNWYDLESGSYGVSDIDLEKNIAKANSASFRVKSDQKEYLKVRIRSNEPFICSKVIWKNYNLK